jgi:hypothetical protein
MSSSSFYIYRLLFMIPFTMNEYIILGYVKSFRKGDWKRDTKLKIHLEKYIDLTNDSENKGKVIEKLKWFEENFYFDHNEIKRTEPTNYKFISFRALKAEVEAAAPVSFLEPTPEGKVEIRKLNRLRLLYLKAREYAEVHYILGIDVQGEFSMWQNVNMLFTSGITFLLFLTETPTMPANSVKNLVLTCAIGAIFVSSINSWMQFAKYATRVAGHQQATADFKKIARSIKAVIATISTEAADRLDDDLEGLENMGRIKAADANLAFELYGYFVSKITKDFMACLGFNQDEGPPEDSAFNQMLSSVKNIKEILQSMAFIATKTDFDVNKMAKLLSVDSVVKNSGEEDDIELQENAEKIKGVVMKLVMEQLPDDLMKHVERAQTIVEKVKKQEENFKNKGENFYQKKKAEIEAAGGDLQKFDEQFKEQVELWSNVSLSDPITVIKALQSTLESVQDATAAAESSAQGDDQVNEVLKPIKDYVSSKLPQSFAKMMRVVQDMKAFLNDSINDAKAGAAALQDQVVSTSGSASMILIKEIVKDSLDTTMSPEKRMMNISKKAKKYAQSEASVRVVSEIQRVLVRILRDQRLTEDWVEEQTKDEAGDDTHRYVPKITRGYEKLDALIYGENRLDWESDVNNKSPEDAWISNSQVIENLTSDEKVRNAVLDLPTSSGVYASLRAFSSLSEGAKSVCALLEEQVNTEKVKKKVQPAASEDQEQDTKEASINVKILQIYGEIVNEVRQYAAIALRDKALELVILKTGIMEMVSDESLESLKQTVTRNLTKTVDEDGKTTRSSMGSPLTDEQIVQIQDMEERFGRGSMSAMVRKEKLIKFLRSENPAELIPEIFRGTAKERVLVKAAELVQKVTDVFHSDGLSVDLFSAAEMSKLSKAVRSANPDMDPAALQEEIRKAEDEYKKKALALTYAQGVSGKSKKSAADDAPSMAPPPPPPTSNAPKLSPRSTSEAVASQMKDMVQTVKEFGSPRKTSGGDGEVDNENDEGNKLNFSEELPKRIEQISHLINGDEVRDLVKEIVSIHERDNASLLRSAITHDDDDSGNSQNVMSNALLKTGQALHVKLEFQRGRAEKMYRDLTNAVKSVAGVVDAIQSVLTGGRVVAAKKITALIGFNPMMLEYFKNPLETFFVLSRLHKYSPAQVEAYRKSQEKDAGGLEYDQEFIRFYKITQKLGGHPKKVKSDLAKAFEFFGIRSLLQQIMKTNPKLHKFKDKFQNSRVFFDKFLENEKLYDMIWGDGLTQLMNTPKGDLDQAQQSIAARQMRKMELSTADVKYIRSKLCLMEAPIAIFGLFFSKEFKSLIQEVLDAGHGNNPATFLFELLTSAVKKPKTMAKLKELMKKYQGLFLELLPDEVMGLLNAYGNIMDIIGPIMNSGDNGSGSNDPEEEKNMKKLVEIKDALLAKNFAEVASKLFHMCVVDKNPPLIIKMKRRKLLKNLKGYIYEILPANFKQLVRLPELIKTLQAEIGPSQMQNLVNGKLLDKNEKEIALTDPSALLNYITDMGGLYIYCPEKQKNVSLPSDVVYALGGEELVMFLNKFQQFNDTFKGAVTAFRTAMKDPFAAFESLNSVLEEANAKKKEDERREMEKQPANLKIQKILIRAVEYSVAHNLFAQYNMAVDDKLAFTTLVLAATTSLALFAHDNTLIGAFLAFMTAAVDFVNRQINFSKQMLDNFDSSRQYLMLSNDITYYLMTYSAEQQEEVYKEVSTRFFNIKQSAPFLPPPPSINFFFTSDSVKPTEGVKGTFRQVYHGTEMEDLADEQLLVRDGQFVFGLRVTYRSFIHKINFIIHFTYVLVNNACTGIYNYITCKPKEVHRPLFRVICYDPWAPTMYLKYLPKQLMPLKSVFAIVINVLDYFGFFTKQDSKDSIDKNRKMMEDAEERELKEEQERKKGDEELDEAARRASKGYDAYPGAQRNFEVENPLRQGAESKGAPFQSAALVDYRRKTLNQNNRRVTTRASIMANARVVGRAATAEEQLREQQMMDRVNKATVLKPEEFSLLDAVDFAWRFEDIITDFNSATASMPTLPRPLPAKYHYITLHAALAQTRGFAKQYKELSEDGKVYKTVFKSLFDTADFQDTVSKRKLEMLFDFYCKSSEYRSIHKDYAYSLKIRLKTIQIICLILSVTITLTLLATPVKFRYRVELFTGVCAAIISALVSWSKFADYESKSASHEVSYHKFSAVATQIEAMLDRAVSTNGARIIFESPAVCLDFTQLMLPNNVLISPL